MGTNNSCNSFIVLILTLVLHIICQPTSSFSTTSINNDEILDRLIRLEDLTKNQDSRLANIEVRNKDHEAKIEKLETNMLHLIKASRNKFAAEVTTREKRPASHIPISIANIPSNYEVSNHLPSNCQDLNEIGHSTNGFYLVKDKIKNKIAVTFCNFQLENRQSELSAEKFFGFIDMKSSSVHFYVQRSFTNSKQTLNSGIIRFNVQILNTGNALNMKTGVFAAPLNGTYHFHFSGQREVFKLAYYTSILSVNIRLNGKDVAQSYTSTMTSLVSCHAILKLKVGDQVDIFKREGWFHGENDIQFTGYLLEEDFIF